MAEHKLMLPGSAYGLKFDDQTGVLYISGRHADNCNGLYFDHATGNNWNLEQLYNFGETLKHYAAMEMHKRFVAWNSDA